MNLFQLYHKGKTYQEIASAFGISRQRVQQILVQNNLRRRKLKYNFKVNPSPSEILVGQKLIALGFEVKYMPFIWNYDLLVNREIKIEVKYRNKASSKPRRYRIALFSKNYDYLIIVVGEFSNPTFYIFNKQQTEKNNYINIVKNVINFSKHQKENHNRWDLIKTTRQLPLELLRQGQPSGTGV